MKIRFILYFLCLCVFVYGQTTQDKTFAEFAHRQDSLMVKAYEKRDTTGYKKLLKEFSAKYNKLTPKDQKANAGYLNGAYYNLCCAYSLLNKKGMALVILKNLYRRGFMIMHTCKKTVI